MISVLPQRVFRVTRSDYAKTAANALSGVGGLHGDGRWHSQGQRIVYTSESSTLCLLERLVHIDEWIAERHPDRVMLQLMVPRVSWIKFEGGELAARDPNWRLEGNPLCRSLGNRWLASGLTCALMVPSATNPTDFNILFNPAHMQFQQVIDANTVLHSTPVELDERVVSLARQRRTTSI